MVSYNAVIQWRSDKIWIDCVVHSGEYPNSIPAFFFFFSF